VLGLRLKTTKKMVSEAQRGNDLELAKTMSKKILLRASILMIFKLIPLW
jgi:hypothetical protein